MEMATEIVERLARIEAGQQMLCQGMSDLQKAVARLAVQEERQTTMKARLDAAWNKLDTLKEDHDKCPAVTQISSLNKQINWLWVLLSGLSIAVGLMAIKVIFGSLSIPIP
jgi:hypothetical protein